MEPLWDKAYSFLGAERWRQGCGARGGLRTKARKASQQIRSWLCPTVVGPWTSPFLSLGPRFFLCNGNTRALGNPKRGKELALCRISACLSYKLFCSSTILSKNPSLPFKCQLSLCIWIASWAEETHKDYSFFIFIKVILGYGLQSDRSPGLYKKHGLPAAPLRIPNPPRRGSRSQPLQLFSF